MKIPYRYIKDMRRVFSNLTSKGCGRDGCWARCDIATTKREGGKEERREGGQDGDGTETGVSTTTIGECPMIN